MRILTYAQALREAHFQLLEDDESVFVIGLGVPTASGVFGTTSGLVDEFGVDRVVDTPASENGITGLAVGAAIAGMRPILVHHRVDFSILSLEPIVNQAAKWHYMYGGQGTAPITIRMVVGRGWGQGPQHSQSLQAWFAHVPGLKVLMPTTPADAKGMLISAVRDDAPTVILEHRWLYGIEGDVPTNMYETPLVSAKVVRKGADITIIATSYMVLESLAAAEFLQRYGIDAEVIDLRSISPYDASTCRSSVEKTGRLLVTDTGTAAFGVTAEIIADMAIHCGQHFLTPPVRVALPTVPCPTTFALADHFYPTATTIINAVFSVMDHECPDELQDLNRVRLDVPNSDFTGPY